MTRATQRIPTDPAANLLGQLPPQRLEFEEALLGSVLQDRQAITHTLGAGLQSEHFYTEQHQALFAACWRLFERMEVIDLTTVRQELVRVGELDRAGGLMYAINLTNKVTSATPQHLEVWARGITQTHALRRLAKICWDVRGETFDPGVDPETLIEDLDRQLTAVHGFADRNAAVQAGEPAAELLGDIARYRANPNPDLLGVNSGIRTADKITLGHRGGDFVIIAGRPAMGKTAFALKLAAHAASEQKKPVAIFSLEMTSKQLSARLMSSYCGVNGEKLRNYAALTDQEFARLERAQQWLEETPIHIVPCSGLSPMQMRIKARELYRRHGIGAIIIDYLQLMSDESNGHRNGNREQEISRISRACKNLAQELDIPMIALSQLSRAVETRGGNKKPMLSDLRESGSLEQDADTVGFLYRPEYYGITQDEEGNSTKGLVELIISKNRHGQPDTAVFKMDLSTGSFYDLGEEPEHETEPDQPYDPTVRVAAGFDDEDVPF